MYIPGHFAQPDLAELHRQIAATPLCSLISQGSSGLQASHLPLLLEAGEGEFGTLYGHFARANPQWQALAAGHEVLAIFLGAEAYVSPGYYPGKAEHGKVVPTWNYIAVHAYGQAEVFEDATRLTGLLQRLTHRHEQQRPQPWALEDAPADYLASMLRAIVGFALPIRRIEGQWKLSQNKQAADYLGVQTGLQASGRAEERRIAEAMQGIRAHPRQR
jgi:transcriptional regulator